MVSIRSSVTHLMQPNPKGRVLFMGDNVVLARNTDLAPKSDLSSQTVAFSHYNNISAQLPIDPATGELVEGGIS